MKKKLQKIAILIPCHNEEEGVAHIIDQMPFEELRHLNFTVEIIVIDNNSTDNTAGVARALGATVIEEPQKGKGNAMRKAFGSLSDDTDFVVMMDGDNTYKPKEIPALLSRLLRTFATSWSAHGLAAKWLKTH